MGGDQSISGDQSIHEERLGRFWVVTGPVGVAVAAGLLVVGMVGGYDSAAGAGVALMVVSIVWSAATIGIERYSRTAFDGAELRVGRDSVAAGHIASLLTRSDIPADILARAASPFPSRGPGGRLFGGAWGLGARLEPIGFTTTDDDEIRIIGTRDPDRLLRHLRSSTDARGS